MFRRAPLLVIAFGLAACAGGADEIDDLGSSADAAVADARREDAAVADAATDAGAGEDAADATVPDATRPDADQSDAQVPPVCNCTPDLATVLPATIQLQSNCRDGNRDPLSYQWSVVARPPGSIATLENATAAVASFAPDVATGTSTPFRIQVVADDGHGGSDSCTTEIFATDDRQLIIQVVWDQDIIDLDLHLLDSIGSADPFGADGWYSFTHDCSYLTRTNDWGVIGDPNDNPVLDIDDTAGFGPEQISFRNVPPGTYTIGVHEYCDSMVGPTTATVRILCNQVLTASVSQVLVETHALWTAAQIDWPGCQVRTSTSIGSIAFGCR